MVHSRDCQENTGEHNPSGKNGEQAAHHIPHQEEVSSTEPEKTLTTDTIFASVKSYEGYIAFQVFTGRKSGLKKVYQLRTEFQALQKLEDFISNVGAPNHVHSDNSKAGTSKVCLAS